MALEWMDDANCLTVGVEVFFPDQGVAHEIRRAKQVCDACPVVQDCLEYALRERIGDGIFGGLVASERRSFMRRMKR